MCGGGTGLSCGGGTGLSFATVCGGGTGLSCGGGTGLSFAIACGGGTGLSFAIICGGGTGLSFAMACGGGTGLSITEARVTKADAENAKTAIAARTNFTFIVFLLGSVKMRFLAMRESVFVCTRELVGRPQTLTLQSKWWLNLLVTRKKSQDWGLPSVCDQYSAGANENGTRAEHTYGHSGRFAVLRRIVGGTQTPS